MAGVERTVSFRAGISMGPVGQEGQRGPAVEGLGVRGFWPFLMEPLWVRGPVGTVWSGLEREQARDPR